MTEDSWIDEIIKEMDLVDKEMELIEIEYRNYISELQYIENCILEVKYIEKQERQIDKYDINSLRYKKRKRIKF